MERESGLFSLFLWVKIFGRSLRAGLYAHTARALATGPVSAAIPNAGEGIFLIAIG